MAFEEQDEKIRRTAKEVADKYHIRIMGETAGRDLSARMEEFFGGSDLAMPWFYSPKTAFGGKTPYEISLEGGQERIKRAIYHLSSGEPC